MNNIMLYLLCAAGGAALGCVWIALDIWHFKRTGYYIGCRP